VGHCRSMWNSVERLRRRRVPAETPHKHFPVLFLLKLRSHNCFEFMSANNCRAGVWHVLK
jgi:hypothetical protein